MFIEWDNLSPSVVGTVSYRACIKDFHTHMILPDTGITHMSEITGQFNMETGLKPSASVGKIVFSPPLHYKYESIGNTTVYITVKFGIFYAVATNDLYCNTIFANTVVTDKLDSAGVPENRSYVDVGGEVYRNECFATPNQIPTMPTSFKYTTGKSIISNNNGLLIVQFGGGMKTDDISDKQKSIVSIIVNAKPVGFDTIGLYGVEIGDYISNTTPTADMADYSDPFIPLVMSCNGTTAKKTKTNTLFLPSDRDIIPIYYIDFTGNVKAFKGVYYYNSATILGVGIVNIGDVTLWLSGKTLDVNSISGISDTDTENFSYAFKVN